jgi:hypothetical protein
MGRSSKYGRVVGLVVGVPCLFLMLAAGKARMAARAKEADARARSAKARDAASDLVLSRVRGHLAEGRRGSGAVADPAPALPPAEFADRLTEALDQEPGPKKVAALRDMIFQAGLAKDPALVELLTPTLLGAGTPQEVWDALQKLWLKLDPPLLAPVDRAMQMVSAPAYYTFLVGNFAAAAASSDHQVHAVDQVHRVASEGAYPKTPLVSSLGYTALASPNRDVRERALDALEDLGDRTTVKALEEHRGRETDAALAERTDELIAELGSR